MLHADYTDFPIVIGPATVHAVRLSGDTRRANRHAIESEGVKELVRRVFGTDATLCHTPAGAPFINGYNGHISISHGSGYALLAVSDTRPVGVDIESPRPTLRRVASRFLSPSEFSVYSSSDALLLRSWTAKEAIFKALGIDSLTIGHIILPEDPEQTVFTAFGQEIELFGISLCDAMITLAAVIGKKTLSR